MTTICETRAGSLIETVYAGRTGWGIRMPDYPRVESFMTLGDLYYAYEAYIDSWMRNVNGSGYWALEGQSDCRVLVERPIVRGE